MRQLDVAHKIISIVAGLIGIYAFVSKAAPSLELPNKWLDLMLPLAVVFLSVITLYRGREATDGKPNRHQEPSIPPLSPTHLAIWNKAKAELESLSFAQAIALRLIYQNPGIFFGLLCQRLNELGFRETGDLIVRPLVMETILVHLDARSNLSPSPQEVIAKAVQEFISKSPP